MNIPGFFMMNSFYFARFLSTMAAAVLWYVSKIGGSSNHKQVNAGTRFLLCKMPSFYLAWIIHESDREAGLTWIQGCSAPQSGPAGVYSRVSGTGMTSRGAVLFLLEKELIFVRGFINLFSSNQWIRKPIPILIKQ